MEPPLVKDSYVAVPWGKRLGFDPHGHTGPGSHQDHTVALAVAASGVSEANEDCFPLGKAEAESYPAAHLDNLIVALHSSI